MDCEITEINRRILASAGPALYFEKPLNQAGISEIPVISNIFGTIERVALGMQIQPDELRGLGQTLAFLRQPEPPEGWREAGALLPLIKKLWAMRPETVKRAPCQEIILTGTDIDLAKLPIQTCWPGEPAPLVTWPLIVTKGPTDAREDGYNLGIYRMQCLGKNRTLMRWLHHRGGAQHFARWKKLRPGEAFPAAAIIGVDPGTLLAAVMPLPETVSEYQFSGLLRGSRLELVPCRTIPLEVPAHAEIILEGTVSLSEEELEGPYGDHTGYYNSKEPFPVFTISAITMRQKPVYLTTYTGRPPDEPSVLGEALNEVFIPLVQQQFPEIIDFWLPPEGCSYRIAVVSIRKSYAGHARRIMMGVWSYLRQFTYTKFVVIVDEDINVRDWKDVMWAISTRVDPVRDMLLVENTPIDYLDFASPQSGLGSKLGIDATNKIFPETAREWGVKLDMSAEIKQRVDARWAELGF